MYSYCLLEIKLTLSTVLAYFRPFAATRSRNLWTLDSTLLGCVVSSYNSIGGNCF